METLEVKGTLPDMSSISIELDVQNAGEDMDIINKIVAISKKSNYSQYMPGIQMTRISRNRLLI